MACGVSSLWVGVLERGASSLVAGREQTPYVDTPSPVAKPFDMHAGSPQNPVRPEGGPLTEVAEDSQGAWIHTLAHPLL